MLLSGRIYHTFPTVVIGLIFALQADAATIDEALLKTYQHSKVLAATKQDVESSKLGIHAAYGNWLPHISAGASSRKATYDPDVGHDYRLKQQTLTVSQQLFNGGASVASLKRAKATLNASKAQLDITEQQTLLQAAQTYIDLYLTEEAVRIFENRVKLLEEHLQGIKVRFEVGEATITALAETEAGQAQAEAHLAATKGKLASLREQYQQLTGEMPQNLVKPNPHIPLPSTIEHATQLALNANPELAKAYANLDITKAEVTSAQANILPRITLDYQISKDRYNHDFSHNNRNTHTTILNLSVPIFQRGQEHVQLKQSKLNREKHRLVAANTKELIANTVQAKWYQWISSQAKLRATEKQLRAAEVAFNGTQQEYSHGLKSNLDYLQAEHNLFQAQLDSLTSYSQEILSRYDLFASMGQLTAEKLFADTSKATPTTNKES